MGADIDPSPTVDVRGEDVDVPPAAALAGWHLEGGTGTLTLPSLGQVVVSANDVVLRASDEHARAGLWARVGDWACAQVLQARGFVVVRGAAIGRGDDVVVLTGAPRIGASVLAAIACRRGWSLIADGHVAMTRDGRVFSGASEITVDTSAAGGLPDSVERRELPTSRPRTALAVDPHPGGRLTALVLLGALPGWGTVKLERTTVGALPPGSLFRASFDRALPVAMGGSGSSCDDLLRGTPDTPAIRVTRPASMGPLTGPECTPPAIADAVLAMAVGSGESASSPGGGS